MDKREYQEGLFRLFTQEVDMHPSFASLLALTSAEYMERMGYGPKDHDIRFDWVTKSLNAKHYAAVVDKLFTWEDTPQGHAWWSSLMSQCHKHEDNPFINPEMKEWIPADHGYGVQAFNPLVRVKTAEKIPYDSTITWG